MKTKLFVGNLSFNITEDQLREVFSTCGSVGSVNLMKDRITGRARGFAFVEFDTAEEANRAVEKIHKTEFQGRTLTVNIARPSEDGSRSFGDGGRGRGGPRSSGGGRPEAAGDEGDPDVNAP